MAVKALPASSDSRLGVLGYRTAKRCMDIVGALCGLLLLFLLLPFIALAMKLESPGPIFFFQTRVGQFGRKFQFIKFRTMMANAHLKQWELNSLNETDGLTFKISGDPRVTRIGRFLRRTSLDELPQFWDILRGHMSLVGPRPPLIGEYERYSDYQKLRMTVPQGLTGLWQVRGRSKINFDGMVDLDIYYALNPSFSIDLQILFYTIPAVLLGRGAK